jgi:hypothetical protein
MMTKDYFYEDQRFSQWWIWLLLLSGCLAAAGIAIAGAYVQLIQGKPFGDKPMSDSGLIIFGMTTIFITVGTIILFRSMRLETRVDKFGVAYRFHPIISKWQVLYREDITHWEITSRFMAGHGMHVGFHHKTFRIKGNWRLAVTLSTGKKRYIGTQQPEQLTRAMVRLFDRQPE